MNILFSTTRQWNPGDEFILFGIRRLLSKFDLKYNPIIYNRHPSITPRRTKLKRRWSKPELVPHYDNSFALDVPGMIDYMIFAGTPEWYGGRRMDDIHKYLRENNVRCAFIGVGIPKKPKFSEDLTHLLKHQTDLFIARDPNCYEAVKPLFPEAHYLPCPALFSASFNQKRNEIKKVGVVIQDNKTRDHSIPTDLLEKLQGEFKELEEAYKVRYVAHYIDDLKLGFEEKKDVLYSAYPEEYEDIFNEFDFVVSTRVHGCGIASSLGIPNILIPHDGRFSTAIKFNSLIYDREKDNLLEMVRSVDNQKSSEELLKHREDSESIYLDLFRKHLPFIK